MSHDDEKKSYSASGRRPDVIKKSISNGAFSGDNGEAPIIKNNHGSMLVAILLIAIVAIVWHFFKPASMLQPVLTAGMWSILTLVISIVCIGFLFVLLLSGIGIILMALFSFLCVLATIFVFPVFFPLLLPLGIVLLFAALWRRRAKRSKEKN